MKRLFLTLTLLCSVFTFASDNFSGRANVKGSLRLISEKGLVNLNSGEIKVELGSPNIITSPVKFFRGDRELVVRDQTSSYTFKIPKELIAQDNKMSVHQSTAGQNAHLIIDERYDLVRTFNQKGIVTCTHYSYCQMCQYDYQGKSGCNYGTYANCPGTQQVMNKVDQFHRSLKLQVYNNEGSAEIETTPKEEYVKTIIGTLSGCF